MAFIKGPILPGDLVMRKPLSRKSKIHPKWDGPFVVLAGTDTDVYQLATANGYIIKNLTNEERLRKLTFEEARKYSDEFWQASSRLRLHDKLAKQQQELHDLDVQIRKATVATLEAQRRGQRTSLERHAELSTRRRQAVKAIHETEAATELPLAEPELELTQRPKRFTRLPSRFRD